MEPTGATIQCPVIASSDRSIVLYYAKPRASPQYCPAPLIRQPMRLLRVIGKNTRKVGSLKASEEAAVGLRDHKLEIGVVKFEDVSLSNAQEKETAETRPLAHRSETKGSVGCITPPVKLLSSPAIVLRNCNAVGRFLNDKALVGSVKMLVCGRPSCCSFSLQAGNIRESTVCARRGLSLSSCFLRLFLGLLLVRFDTTFCCLSAAPFSL